MNAVRDLQTLLDDLRGLALAGRDIPMEEVWRLCRKVRDADFVLTGKTDNRYIDRDGVQAMRLTQGHRWDLHLSDGGYSRLTLDLDDETPMRLDLALSRPNVVEVYHRAMAEPA